MSYVTYDTTIQQLVERSHRLAVEKGWHETWPDGKVKSHTVPIGEKLALIHSEISEALEAFREHGVFRRCPNCNGVGEFDGVKCAAGCNAGFMASWVYPADDLKPEGFVVELADAVIRIADLCGALGLDLAAAIEQKHAYNATRPYRHGGKRA